MAFRQTFEAAAGAVRGAVTGAQPTTVLVHYTVPAGVLVNDITEACAIPHGCYVIDATVFQDGVGAGCTLDVGILSGKYGKADDTRTMGNEIFAALAVATAGASARGTAPQHGSPGRVRHRRAGAQAQAPSRGRH